MLSVLMRQGASSIIYVQKLVKSDHIKEYSQSAIDRWSKMAIVSFHHWS